jgi:hypothetical protein
MLLLLTRPLVLYKNRGKAETYPLLSFGLLLFSL